MVFSWLGCVKATRSYHEPLVGNRDPLEGFDVSAQYFCTDACAICNGSSESLAGPARMNTVKRGLIELTLSSGGGGPCNRFTFFNMCRDV